MKKYAVIVAGGSGTRMGSPLPKQFIDILGKPLIYYTLQTFLQSYPDLKIILVLPDNYLSVGKKILADEFGGSDRIILTKGGDSRYQSVKNGLSLIAEEAVVFVHDGVRCLVTQDLIHRCYEQTLLKGSAVPAIPVTESVRAIDGHLHKPADRNQLRLIQTPQTFLSSILLPAFTQDEQDNFTDEATVVESSGQEVFLVEGEFTNMKITRPHDLDIAQKILGAR